MPTGKRPQQGSVFMGMLVTVAVVAVMLMEVGTLWSSVLQRERELELLARGNQIRRAIGLYYAAGNTYPKSLADLELDRRQPTVKRYLRRAYADPLTGSAYEQPHQLPRHLDDAVEKLMQCRPLVDLFGDHFIQTYSAIKETEYREYFDVISPWEREHLLLNV